jgi:hypothetical protein
MLPFVVCLILLLAAVLELVRRRLLREEFSWLWIGACLLLLALAAIPPVRDKLAHLMPDSGGLQLVLLFMCLFLVALCLDFSIQISSQSNRIKNLAQEVALLRRAIEELRAEDE